MKLIKIVDKCNGYGFGSLGDHSMESLMSCAVGAEYEYGKIKDVREKYIDTTNSEDTSDIAMQS